MVRPKTEEAIALMRENGILVSKALAEVGKIVAPGVTTLELNRVAETFIRDNGAIPSFLGYDGFPYALCISVNDVVVHGFPSVAAGLQDITSGYLIQYNTEQVAGVDVYDFGPVSWFWLAAALISFVLPVLNWKKMKNN